LQDSTHTLDASKSEEFTGTASFPSQYETPRIPSKGPLHAKNCFSSIIAKDTLSIDAISSPSPQHHLDTFAQNKLLSGHAT